ncbi:ABC transporter permease [Curtobacterium sp. SP.BCo]|uniref:ABC transporter permease n=1 Tax=Curtobacterium sp. SP.BCo TaxID=3435229 RepID=UPI003F73EE81
MSTPRNDVPRNNDLPDRDGGSRQGVAPKQRATRPSTRGGSKPRRGAPVAGTRPNRPGTGGRVRQAPVPEPQRISRYRRWFGTLHPSLQLIGLQLWMPLFFIVGFCLCYVFAFHAPHPHDVPVALVGSDPTLVAAVQKALPGEYLFHTYDSLAQAKRDVLAGTMAVAYDPSTNEVFKATAHQFQVASLVPVTLSTVLTGIGVAAPTVTELAPLPAYDEYGTVAMYVMLAWCIGGYMVAMFIGIMGGPLRHRTRMAVIVVGGLVISLITNTLAGPVVGAIHGHWIELVLIAWGWIVAIGLAVNGLSYFVGRFIAAPAMICFVFLSMPSSGGAYPKWFMPEPFAWLNNVVVGSSMVDMIKHQIYGVGPSYSRGLITMACYAGAGLVLMYFGKKWWERRRIRAIVTGRTTMFQDAQTANREFLGKQRDAELERNGLTSTETGTLSVLRDEDWEDERVNGDVFMGGRDGLETESTPTGRIPVVRGADRTGPVQRPGGAATGPRTRPVPRVDGSRAPARSDAGDTRPHGRHADR